MHAVSDDENKGAEDQKPNQKNGDEILKRMLKTPPDPHEKPASGRPSAASRGQSEETSKKK
jgi:hypothetical protein